MYGELLKQGGNTTNMFKPFRLTQDENAIIPDIHASTSNSHALIRMSWNERHRLARDLGNLAPPDVAGALRICYTKWFNKINASTYYIEKENTPHHISAWDASLHTLNGTNASPIPVTTEERNPMLLECALNLDKAPDHVLVELRKYVDECYIPCQLPPENCMICEGLWSNGNVHFCGNDACDSRVRVHEECFGVLTYNTSDGKWLCPSCLLGRQLLCAVCMQTGGALKPLSPLSLTPMNAGYVDDYSTNPSLSLDDQKWVHVLCALAIPELILRDVPTLEPVDGFDDIENGRFRFLCCICRKRGGASVICESNSCNVGMHPQCAANAGYMLGCEGNPLGVYCEKHLPAPPHRVVGAKRWISEEDLIDEIVHNELNNSKVPRCSEMEEHNTLQAENQFILESTPALSMMSRMLGSRSILPFSRSLVNRQHAPIMDIQATKYERAKLHPTVQSVPSMIVRGLEQQNPLQFPPVWMKDERIGLPPFPNGPLLVGAIIDYLTKESKEWVRSIILNFDDSSQRHQIRIIQTNAIVEDKLTPTNALVLYLAQEKLSPLDSIRVRLYRPMKQGNSEWRPVPQMYGKEKEK